MADVGLAEVVTRLGLRGAGAQWAESLATEQLSVVARLPEADEAAALLDSIGVDLADVADVVSCLPQDDEQGQAWHWLLSRAVNRIAGQIGHPEESHFGWPDWTSAKPGRTLRQRCFMAHLYLACIPHTRAAHRRLGISDDVSSASLADLGRHMAIHRSTFGDAGVEAGWWLSLSLRAEVFDLGRLQFNYFRLRQSDESPWWFSPEQAAALGSGFGDGEACLGVHIPAGGHMSVAACDESFALAADFFAQHFALDGGQSRRVATCMSWLLDEQLATMLPANSNIVAFQNRFNLVPGLLPGDRTIVDFVFRRALPPLGATAEFLDGLPYETTLERAVVDHLRAGNHFYARAGWVDLDSVA